MNSFGDVTAESHSSNVFRFHCRLTINRSERFRSYHTIIRTGNHASLASFTSWTSLAWDTRVAVEDGLSCVGWCGRQPLLRGIHRWLWKTASLAWDARVAVEDGLSCVGCTGGCGRRPLLRGMHVWLWKTASLAGTLLHP